MGKIIGDVGLLVTKLVANIRRNVALRKSENLPWRELVQLERERFRKFSFSDFFAKKYNSSFKVFF